MHHPQDDRLAGKERETTCPPVRKGRFFHRGTANKKRKMS
jgi:hypothetical protein